MTGGEAVGGGEADRGVKQLTNNPNTQIQLCPRYEGQLNHMVEPILYPSARTPSRSHHYPTADGRTETDITD